MQHHAKVSILKKETRKDHNILFVRSLKKSVKKIKEKPFHTEGLGTAEWVLIDYINVVVHVFQKKTREFYNIEELWGDAKSTLITSNY